MASAFEEKLFQDLQRGVPGYDDQVAAARWGTADDLKDSSWTYDRKAVFLGYLRGRGIGRKDDQHVFLAAGSRSGKGVSLVIPNLLLYEGSVLALDPKGELAAKTKAERERKGQKCHVLDPFGANRVYPSSAYNPLVEIDPASKTVVDDAAMIADALIVHDGGDTHWTDTAKLLLRGLILLVLLLPEDERDLVTVREMLMLTHHTLRGADDMATPPDGFSPREYALFVRMAEETGIFDDVLAATGEAFLAMGPRERGSVISTARTQTGFLDSGPLRGVLRGGTLRMRDLKRAKTTVYLCLPASRMATHARWFRVVINTALTVFEQDETVPSPPVLMMLDEFPVLGTMPRLEAAAGQIASFGIKLFIIVQDLTQLKRHYKDGWETFLGNAGTALFFGNSDVTTVKYVSERLGARGYKLIETSKVGLAAQLGGASPISESQRVDPLFAPHEVERILARNTLRVLVLVPGAYPVILQRAVYHDDEAFAALTKPAGKP